MTFLRSPWLPALLVFAVGVALAGAGPVNGDAAVYLDQAADGALAERWTHSGFIMILMMFHAIGLPEGAADVLSAACCAFAVGRLGATLGRHGSPGLAGWLLAGLVVGWAPFGEVDPVWLALVAVGCGPHAIASAVALGAAVAVSPTALAAIPWIVMKERDLRWVGPAVAVAGLTVLSAGDWWVGTRGVVTGGWAPSPWTHVTWVLVPLAMGVRGLRPLDALALVGLLAPGDVPGHWVLALPCVAAASTAVDRRWWAAIAALCSLGAQHAVSTRDRAVRENAAIERIAAEIRPGDAVVGPWSWGVRVGIAATGDPYGVPFSAQREPCQGRRVHVPLVTWEPCER
ncbi:MAG: hypothetical protein R3F61_19320 [Myxococcota bacterium]